MLVDTGLLEKAKEEINRLQIDDSSSDPDVVPPVPTSYDLAGAYYQTNGIWTKAFEVRELTGRDEEYLAKFKEQSKVIVGILERGLVRVGEDTATPEVIDSLLGGDWETALLAIRAVTFGSELEMAYRCFACDFEYRALFDILRLPIRTCEPEDFKFEVVGRHGTRYLLTHSFGSTQRKLLFAEPSTSLADLNSTMLKDCVLEINGKAVIGMDAIRDIPLADRRKILKKIDSLRVGPKLGEVTTKCPSCDAEQSARLSLAAMFQ